MGIAEEAQAAQRAPKATAREARPRLAPGRRASRPPRALQEALATERHRPDTRRPKHRDDARKPFAAATTDQRGPKPSPARSKQRTTGAAVCDRLEAATESARKPSAPRAGSDQRKPWQRDRPRQRRDGEAPPVQAKSDRLRAATVRTDPDETRSRPRKAERIMVWHLVLMKPQSRSGGRRSPRRWSRASIARFARFRPSAKYASAAGSCTAPATRAAAPDSADFMVSIGFDDLAGLQTYLRHPAHEELAARFYQSLSSALIYDFEAGGVERNRALTRCHSRLRIFLQAEQPQDAVEHARIRRASRCRSRPERRSTAPSTGPHRCPSAARPPAALLFFAPDEDRPRLGVDHDIETVFRPVVDDDARSSAAAMRPREPWTTKTLGSAKPFALQPPLRLDLRGRSGRLRDAWSER